MNRRRYLLWVTVWTVVATGPAVVRADSDEESTIIDVPEVEVEAESDDADDAPAEGPDTLDEDYLERRDTGNLADALEWLPSVRLRQDTSSRTSAIVEGLPASQFDILEDGLSTSRMDLSRDGAARDVSSIDITGRPIEEIELHRGLGPLGSGPASGIIASIERAPLPDETGFDVNARGRMPATQFRAPYYSQGRANGFMFAAPAETWRLGVTGGVDSRRPVDVNGDGVDDLPDRLRYHAGLQAQWIPDEETEDLHLELQYTQDETESPVGPDAPLQDLTATRRAALRVTGEWRPAEKWTLEHRGQVLFNDHQFDKLVRDSGYERPKSHTRQWRLTQDVAARRTVGAHELGAEIYGEYMGLSRDGETGSVDRVDWGHVGLSLAETWTPSREVELTTRLWGDWHTRFGVGWMADVSIGWRATDWFGLRASGSRTRRLPTAEELFLFFDHSEVGYKVEGNPNLRPEKMWSGRLGFQFSTAEETVVFDLGGFYHRLDDLITSVEADGSQGAIPTFTYDNVARAHTAGLNARLRVPDVVAEIGLRLDYTYLPVARDLVAEERLSLRAAHQGTLEVRRAWLDDRLETWIDLNGRSRLEVPDGAPAGPAYALLGLGVRWQGDEGLSAALHADNLLDQTNATWGPKPGLTVMFSLGYRFSNDSQHDPSEEPHG
jgi:outer membrane receptor for ferrienterochelin and colicins